MIDIDQEQFKERVREAVDLKALVEQDGLVLKKASANEWTALCPFHNEDSPSFTVNPVKRFFHCFGCSTHGDCFDWLIKRRGMDFKAALDFLAQWTHTPRPEGCLLYTSDAADE